jgi:hypothetical protein
LVRLCIKSEEDFYAKECKCYEVDSYSLCG